MKSIIPILNKELITHLILENVTKYPGFAALCTRTKGRCTGSIPGVWDRCQHSIVRNLGNQRSDYPSPLNWADDLSTQSAAKWK